MLRCVFMSVKGKDVVGSICKGLQTESIGRLRYVSSIWFEGTVR